MTGRRGRRAVVQVREARFLPRPDDTTVEAVGMIPCKKNARLFRIATRRPLPATPRGTHQLYTWATTSVICTADVNALLLCIMSPLRPFNLRHKIHSPKMIAVGVQGRPVPTRRRQPARVGRMERLPPRGAEERKRNTLHPPQLLFSIHLRPLRLVRLHLPRPAIAVPMHMICAHESFSSILAHGMPKATGVVLLSHRAPHF